jgi:hypothetical protein
MMFEMKINLLTIGRQISFPLNLRNVVLWQINLGKAVMGSLKKP